MNNFEEKENLRKPPSSSRRDSSSHLGNAVSIQSKPSTRREPEEPIVEEEEVSETDQEEDEDEVQPPRKKKRPSLEKSDEEEDRDRDVEAGRPKRISQAAKRGRASRAPALVQPRSGRLRKPVAISSDEEEYTGKVPDPEEEDSELEEQKPKQKPKSRQTSKRGRPSRATQPRSARGQKLVPMSDDDGEANFQTEKGLESDVEEYEMPKRRVSMSPKKPSSRTNHRTSEEHSMDEDEGETKPTGVDEEDEELEEEKSLLIDYPPSLPPASQSQAKAVPEEPKGPQSRLVIHKLALVNFKSYAGRQEIGPFHKVQKI